MPRKGTKNILAGSGLIAYNSAAQNARNIVGVTEPLAEKGAYSALHKEFRIHSGYEVLQKLPGVRKKR
jgi:hypothetical protein